MSQYYQIKNMDTDQPEIHIDGPIQMDKSILAVLFGLPEQTAVAILNGWTGKTSRCGLTRSAESAMPPLLSIRHCENIAEKLR